MTRMWREIALIIWGFSYSCCSILGQESSPHKPAKTCLEIVSPGYIGTDSLATLNDVGPALDSAMDILKAAFPSVSISQVYLQDNSVRLCSDLMYNVQDMLAKWYYTVRNDRCAVAIITSG